VELMFAVLIAVALGAYCIAWLVGAGEAWSSHGDRVQNLWNWWYRGFLPHRQRELRELCRDGSLPLGIYKPMVVQWYSIAAMVLGVVGALLV